MSLTWAFAMAVSSGTVSEAGVATSAAWGGCRCARPHPCFDAAPWEELAESGVEAVDVEPLDTSDENGAHFSDPLWLADQPAGMQNIGQQGSPLRPGWSAANSTPAKYVTVLTAEDASKAIKFATKHNIALSIKNTGHDWSGRSAFQGGGNLMLWTHKNIQTEWLDDFTPDGCTESFGTAATLGSGVMFWQAYDEAKERGRLFVGGTCSTVGHVGFTLLGGYGDYSRMYGSGATNLLEAEVVLADGSVVKASACNEYSDLFRALRGGGGSFGLITKATYRTYPMPTDMGSVGREYRDQDITSIVDQFLAWYMDICDRGLAKHFGGKIFVYSEYVDLQLEYVDLERDACTRLLQEGDHPLPGGLECEAKSVAWPPEGAVSSERAEGWMTSWAGDSASAYHVETFTRYFRREHLDDGNRKTFAETLARLAVTLPQDYKAFFTVTLNYGLGMGSKTALRWVDDTTAHPEVRDALGAVKLARRLHPFTPTSATQVNQEFWENLQLMHRELEVLLPGAGSYANEGDRTEENWRERYWGDNYPELHRTKRKYDPAGVLSCYQCVGSELAKPACRTVEDQASAAAAAQRRRL
jgi:FAD/FMN-containing dehydrogenase